MNTLVKKFLNNESGAITVDWVVLTAGIVGLGIAVMAAVGTGAISATDEVDSAIQDVSVTTF